MKKGLSGTPVEFVFLTWWPFDKNFVDTNLDNVILIKQKCVLSFFWGRVWVQVLRVWVSRLSHGILTTKPAFTEWQITIRRSPPPPKVLRQ